MARSTEALFHPRSIAVVGASAIEYKWGHHVAKHALKGNRDRPVYLVNQRGGEILGEKVYPSLSQLPEPPDLIAITVPAAATESVVQEGLALGARCFVMMSGGFGETDEAGRQRELRILASVRARGATLMGPNCIGIHDAESELYVTRILYPNGSIGVVSQSGLITHDLSRYSLTYGNGLSRAINLGNQTDFNLCDAVEAFVDHRPTRALIVYCEDLVDGRRFMRAAAAVARSGIPVLLLTIGASEVAAGSAQSHTGALVTSLAVVDAACKQAGVIRVTSTREAMAIAAAFATVRHRPRGRRVGVLTDGGGPGTLSCEMLAQAGLTVPEFSPGLRASLRRAAGARTSTRNPVDLAGEADEDISIYRATAKEILQSAEVDLLFMTGFFGGYSASKDQFGTEEARLAVQIAADSAASGCPLLVQSVYPDFETGRNFRVQGVPVYRDIDTAIRAVDALTKWDPASAGELPTSLEPVDGPPVPGDYWSARELLRCAGVAFTRASIADATDDIESVAAGVGYPLVLKAMGLVHKSDLGGVALGIRDRESLLAHHRAMTERLRPAGFSVEQEAPVTQGVELIVGAKIDARFGPIMSVGLGGIFVETLNDVATAFAPVDVDVARGLIMNLRGAPLLTGQRGRAALDITSAAQVIAALSRLACELAGRVESMEINPLLVLQDRAIALDARVIPRSPRTARLLETESQCAAEPST